MNVRKTVKGSKKVLVHIARVWHWDGVEDEARLRTLVITVDRKSKQVKYSFSNGLADRYTPGEYAWFQCNRYFVERSFDDAKNEVGLSGYQVQNWLAWHHHVSFVMGASLYILKRSIANVYEYPLMSFRDARILTICFAMNKQ